MQLKNEVQIEEPADDDRAASVDAQMRLAMAIKRREAERNRGRNP